MEERKFERQKEKKLGKNISRKGELEKQQKNKESDLEKHRVRELIHLPSDSHKKKSDFHMLLHPV